MGAEPRRVLGRPSGLQHSGEFIDEEARHALEASQVLEELTPADACEAVDGSRFTPTLDERMETTVRALRRRTQ